MCPTNSEHIIYFIKICARVNVEEIDVVRIKVLGTLDFDRIMVR